MTEKRVALQDPRTKFPRPPFPMQSQAFPGLDGKMTPRPDHGEHGHVGSGRLAGRKAGALPGDIREEAFCRQLVDLAVAALGGLDILVNNAGSEQAFHPSSDTTGNMHGATGVNPAP